MTPEELTEATAEALAVTVTWPLREGGQKVVLLVDDALRRAQREVELLERLDHENVVKVASELVELGDPVEGAAWHERFLDGEDLGDLLGPEPWDWDEVRRMALDVSRARACRPP